MSVRLAGWFLGLCLEGSCVEVASEQCDGRCRTVTGSERKQWKGRRVPLTGAERGLLTKSSSCVRRRRSLRGASASQADVGRTAWRTSVGHLALRALGPGLGADTPEAGGLLHAVVQGQRPPGRKLTVSAVPCQRSRRAGASSLRPRATLM